MFTMRCGVTLVFGLIRAASAHYTFNSLILNGVVTPQWQYVRRHTKGINPTEGRAAIASTDFRCNTGAAGAEPATQVATVAAGAT
jgi:hypothetical protein